MPNVKCQMSIRLNLLSERTSRVFPVIFFACTLATLLFVLSTHQKKQQTEVAQTDEIIIFFVFLPTLLLSCLYQFHVHVYFYPCFDCYAYFLYFLQNKNSKLNWLRRVRLSSSLFPCQMLFTFLFYFSLFQFHFQFYFYSYC